MKRREDGGRASGLGLLPVVLVLLLSSVEAVAPGRFQFRRSIYTTTEDFGVAYVTVQRHLGSDGRAAVYVSSLANSGNAVVGQDFKPIYNRSLVWQDGDDSEMELYIKILNDGTPQEVNKSFVLALHDANGATINSDRNTTTIVLTPPTNIFPGTFRFLNATLQVNESNSAAFVVPVVWEGGTSASAQVKFQLIDGTATMASDFSLQSPTSSVLTWTRGESTTQTISLMILDDGLYEQSETFSVRLSLVDPAEGADPASVGALGNISKVDVTILGPNDVLAGTLQLDAACFPACPSTKYQVQDGGIAQVIVQRRNGSDGAASVTLRTVDGTAIAGVDYKLISRIITWANGDASERTVIVETIAGFVRSQNVRFALELTDAQGGVVADSIASTSYVDILGPRNVLIGDVNFAAHHLLDDVLAYPDLSFLPIVTRMDSGLRLCPRIVVRRPGMLSMLVQRNFANLWQAASVTIDTIEDTAAAGVDFEAVAAKVVSWINGDLENKRLEIKILDPGQYYVGRRSFWLEMSSVTNVALGNCHLLQVVLDSVSQAPHVVSFDLNMNAATLSLVLSDSVLAQSLDTTRLQLQSAAKDAQETYQFSGLTTTQSADGTQIVLNIAISDLNAIKNARQIAKTAGSTFLSVKAGLFDYVLNNCTGPGLETCPHARFSSISSSAGLAVSAFATDVIGPVLLSFTLDLPRKFLKLRFSEPVNHSSVRIDLLSLSDTATGIELFALTPTSSVLFLPNPDPMRGALLWDNNKLPSDATYVTLLLGDTDIAGIQAVGNGQVGVSVTSTFLTMARGFVVDFAMPANPAQALFLSATQTSLLQATASDCSVCTGSTFVSSSCSDTKDRVCTACTVCPTNSFALVACTPFQDTVCYPCNECRGGQYIAIECSSTVNRVCAACTRCTQDEYEASPCYNGVNRICRTCDSCTLTTDQQRLCRGSQLWKRKQMRMPYGCPLPTQQFQSLEARLQRAKSNRCGAGRCSCSGNLPGNANPNGDSYPNDPRCTGPDVYNIFL